MTVTANPPSTAGSTPAQDLVTLTIDDVEVSVPSGTLVIRAAETVGIAIPRFCDHPLLSPVGACRQCLVEVATPGPDGTPRPMPKPQASCTLEATPGMVVRTQQSSPMAEKAQQGVMELLLINHPLDCPVCDKGGECPLQNQAMANGRSTSRFVDTKRTFPKPIRISTQVLLDRERCVLCQRCTRFSREIAGDPFIDLQMRGAQQQIGTFSPGVLGYHSAVDTEGDAMADESGQPFASYFSGNTVQICPVGALTGAAYRFRSRPFDLVSTPGVCEHCASGCALRVDHRRGSVLRRLAGDDPEVNEEWNCDKGRWAFTWATAADRLADPLVRDGDGVLRPASWPEALEAAAAGLAAARDAAGVGVLVGGRVSVEDAYAYAKFARVVLRHERRRLPGAAALGGGGGLPGPRRRRRGPHPHLRRPRGRARRAARRPRAGGGVADRLPAAAQGRGPRPGGPRRRAVDQSRPGQAGRAAGSGGAGHRGRGSRRRGLGRPPGGRDLASAAPARRGGPGRRAARREPGWAERRIAAGGRHAAPGWPGCHAGRVSAARSRPVRCPGLLPGGRPVADAAARVDVAAVWGVPSLPVAAGLDTAGIVGAAAERASSSGIVVGGVDPADLPDPAAALEALDAAGFVVSLEVRAGAVTERADVVLPVAPPSEKAGTFLDWEGRWRSFPQALASNAMSDFRVLDALADQMGARPRAARRRAGAGRARRARRLGGRPGPGPHAGGRGAARAVRAARRSCRPGTCCSTPAEVQDGEPHLAGTAHRAVARLSAPTAAEIGAGDGDPVTVSTTRGALTLPLVVTDLPDHVVWLPTNSAQCAVRATLGADSGAVVSISRGEA